MSAPSFPLASSAPSLPSLPSLIGSDVEIKGTIRFQGELHFDGTLTGGSIIGKTLVIGERATIQADIKVHNLRIKGQVTGNVDVAERTVLEPSGALYGDLVTARLTMSDGATFVGGSKIGPRDQAPTAPIKQEPPKAA